MASIVGFLSWLMLSPFFVVEIDLSDKACDGNFLDVCEVGYNLTYTGVDSYFYIYNKDKVELEFMPNVKRVVNCKKDNRFTSSARKDRELFPCGVGWRQKEWHEPLTDKYGYIEKFYKNKKQEFKLVIFKHKPNDRIKWGGVIFNNEFDPILFAKDKQANKLFINKVDDEQQIVMKTKNDNFTIKCRSSPAGNKVFNRKVNSYVVDYKSGRWKWGAYSNLTGWNKHQCVIKSRNEIRKIGNSYYVIDGRGGFKYDDSDVCPITHPVTNKTVECKYRLEQLVDKKNRTYWQLGTVFWSEQFMDPSWTYENLETKSITVNVTNEGDNSSHLSTLDEIDFYMPFDVNISQTTVYDYTENNYDAVISNEAHYVDEGKYGGGFSFDGVDDEIASTTSFVLDSSGWTMSLWYKILSNEGVLYQYIISTANYNANPSLNCFIHETDIGAYADNISCALGDDDSTDIVIRTNSTPGTRTEWQFLTLVKENNDFTIYINGTNETTESFPDFGDLTVSAIMLGSRTDHDVDRFFNGTLDEVMIINRSLSSSEVLDAYNLQHAKLYNPGTQTFLDQNVTLGVDNKLNWTMTSQTLQATEFSGRIGGWNEDYGYNVTDNNIVAFYGLNNQSSLGENDTHVYDITGNGNNGTVIGATPVSSGRYEGAFNLDSGNDQYIQVSDNSQFTYTNGFTWGLWIKPTEEINNSYTESFFFVMSQNLGGIQDGDINLFWDKDTSDCSSNDGQLAFEITEDSTTYTICSDSDTWNAEQWYHITVSYNDSIMLMYVDGVLQQDTQILIDSEPGSGNVDLHIGSHSASPWYGFYGVIDEVGVWNRSLSKEEIKSLYLKSIAIRTYTASQNITPGSNIFTVNDNETNFIAELTFNSNINNSYTPVLEGDVNLDSSNMRAYDINNNVYHCGYIDRSGVYTQNQSITANVNDCIVIEADDVLLDCQDYVLDGNNGKWNGFAIEGTSGDHITNVTINNCSIINFKGSNLKITYMDNSLITNTTISHASTYSLYMADSDNNVFNNLIIANNTGSGDQGITMVNGNDNNNFTDILVYNNAIGLLIGIPSGSNQIFTRLNITNNIIGLDRGTWGNDILFYNNIWNNTLNINDKFTSTSDFYNTSLTATTSIIGGANSGGNLWTSPTGDNYSDTCTVTITDNICDNPMNVTDGTECIGCTGDSIDELPLSYKTVTPSGDVPLQAENMTNITTTNSSINATVDLPEIANISWWKDGVNVANTTYPISSYNYTDLTANTQYNLTSRTYNASGMNMTVTSENSILVTTNANVGGNTCTCPGLNNDWGVDCSENCVLEVCDIGTGNLWFYNSGRPSISNEINITAVTNGSSTCHVWGNSTGRIMSN